MKLFLMRYRMARRKRVNPWRAFWMATGRWGMTSHSNNKVGWHVLFICGYLALMAGLAFDIQALGVVGHALAGVAAFLIGPRLLMHRLQARQEGRAQ